MQILAFYWLHQMVQVLLNCLPFLYLHHQVLFLHQDLELEFCVFCIENIATRLGINPKEVYTMIAEQSDILNDYIVPEYEMLHTQGKDYIVDDIIEVMKERGILE